MGVFIISTDLRKPGKDYAKFYAEMARIGASRVVLSVFVANLRQSAVEARDALMKFVDNNDRISVFEIKDWATYNGLGGVAHLKRLLP